MDILYVQYGLYAVVHFDNTVIAKQHRNGWLVLKIVRKMPKKIVEY